jgi:hypothetical protein
MNTPGKERCCDRAKAERRSRRQYLAPAPIDRSRFRSFITACHLGTPIPDMRPGTSGNGMIAGRTVYVIVIIRLFLYF